MPELAEMRRVAREGVLMAGGARAILLQVAHPAIGRGVAEHSNFAARPINRLHATMTYIYAVTFGTAHERERVVASVSAVHRGIVGPGYDASDPDLQLWVAATLYDTAVTLYERLFGALPPDMADDVYRQYSVLGTALQLPESQWPRDRTAFAAYWEQTLASLRVTADARKIARDLLHPRPLVMRAMAPANLLITAGLLPETVRAAYGLRWNAPRQKGFDGLMNALAHTYPHLPAVLRQLPKSYYLWRLRRHE